MTLPTTTMPPMESVFSSPEASRSSSNGSPSQLLNGLGSVAATEPRTEPVASATGANEGRAPPPTVPAACLACRSKHLKCDGKNPCSRCSASDQECIYVASRRGYKGPKRNTAQNPNKRHASDSPTETGDSCPMLLGATPGVATPSVSTFNPALGISLPETTVAGPLPWANPGLSSLQLYRNPFLNGGAIDTVTAFRPQQSVADRCLDSFYFHFFAGHPFVLPKEQILRLSAERPLGHLLAAMRWIGSLYIDVGPTRATFFDEANRLSYAPDVIKDGFLVQALVILLIGLDGSCQQEKARQVLSDVERIALEIGLYQRSFAASHGGGDLRMEESWRRTWWDLYVVDGMVAGVHRQSNFLLFDIMADVALPCEEHEFLSGQIPRPMYLEDFEDQVFSGEEHEFSSFTYRIAAIRNLGRFMRLPDSPFPSDENLDRVESLLSNWRMHLPASKKDSLDKDCRLDEMIFQAHMITHACSIMLHQPHSQLDTSPARDVNSCAPHRMVPSGEHFNAHTRHIITAATEISKMITYAVPITSHTHFFTCVITLSSIVHLSKWALYYIADEDNLRQQIRLNIGALNKLSAVWKAANTASGQVKGVAQEIYKAKKTQQQNPSFWVGFSQEEILSSMAADENIMSEINHMLQ